MKIFIYLVISVQAIGTSLLLSDTWDQGFNPYTFVALFMVAMSLCLKFLAPIKATPFNSLFYVGLLMISLNVAINYYQRVFLTYQGGFFSPQTLHEMFFDQLEVGRWDYAFKDPTELIKNPYSKKHYREFVLKKVVPDAVLSYAVLAKIVDIPELKPSEVQSIVLETASTYHLNKMFLRACGHIKNYDSYNKEVIQLSLKRHFDKDNKCHVLLKSEV